MVYNEHKCHHCGGSHYESMCQIGKDRDAFWNNITKTSSSQRPSKSDYSWPSNQRTSNNSNNDDSTGTAADALAVAMLAAMAGLAVIVGAVAIKITTFTYDKIKESLDDQYGEVEKNKYKAAILTAAFLGAAPATYWAATEVSEIHETAPFLKYNTLSALGIRADYTIGTRLEKQGNDVIVSRVRREGPAAKAGFRAGDIIEHVNSQSFAGLSKDEATKRLKGALNNDHNPRVNIRIKRFDDSGFRPRYKSYSATFVNPQLAERTIPASDIRTYYYYAANDVNIYSENGGDVVARISAKSCVVANPFKQTGLANDYHVTATGLTGTFQGRIDGWQLYRPSDFTMKHTCHANIIPQ